MRLLTTFILVVFCVTACHRAPTYIEPVIQAPPHPKELQRETRGYLNLPQDFSCSPFSALTPEEMGTDWGKEYAIGLMFAEDFDLYRAITQFKRALYLLPFDQIERRQEIEYATVLAYYLGKKYVEVVYNIESTGLVCVDATFPAFSDLLLILYDSYEQLGKCDHAAHILKLIEQKDHDQARRLTLLSAIKQADFDTICGQGYDRIITGYEKGTKSVRKAEMLNAVLPGAGYWYVGQKQTAVTAFLVNGLFIAAATQFFIHGHYAAGAITTSLESGWYFGGIYGAGLAAKSYNERLYCTYAQKITQREGLFPLLMLKYSF